jgi:hypothetical protein
MEAEAVKAGKKEESSRSRWWVGEGRWTGEERRRENRGGQEKRATADAPRPRRPQKETVGGVNRVGRRPGWLAAWWGRGVTSRAKEEISQGRRARRGRHRTGRTRTRTHGTTVHLGDRIRGDGRPCARVRIRGWLAAGDSLATVDGRAEEENIAGKRVPILCMNTTGFGANHLLSGGSEVSSSSSSSVRRVTGRGRAREMMTRSRARNQCEAHGAPP